MTSETQLKQSSPKIPICKICFKEIKESTIHSFLEKDPQICHDCLLQMSPVLNKFRYENIDCFHIYFYNTKIQELLYQFKGCKDYELKDAFLDYFRRYLNFKFRGYILIPAPSSEKSNKKRGFNHVVEMFKNLNLKMVQCIHKRGEVKQADLTTKERKKIAKHLYIEDIDLRGKKVLLIDDVFTTGSTIKAMIDLVKQKGAKKIKVLLMSKTIDLEKRE